MLDEVTPTRMGTVLTREIITDAVIDITCQWKVIYPSSHSGTCNYCGADDWFYEDNSLLCASCFTPEHTDAGSYEDYITKVRAEEEAKCLKFTTTERPPAPPPGQNWAWIWGEDEKPRPTSPPFWKLLG